MYLYLEQEENEFKFLDLLSMLDETFRKLSVNDFDCQKRAVCEAHLRHAEGKLGPVARRINYIFQYLLSTNFSVGNVCIKTIKLLLHSGN